MITPGPVRCPPTDETLAWLNEPERGQRLNDRLREEALREPVTAGLVAR
jgi:hypothetical protein